METGYSSATQTASRPYTGEKNREAEIDTSPLAEGMDSNSYNDLYENNDYNPISNAETSSSGSQAEEDYDLQSELESKFDKLFGSTSNNNENYD